MKILFITRGFPSAEDPMDGNYEAVQAKAIAAKGHDVYVLSVKFRKLTLLFQNKNVRHHDVDGVHVYECNRNNFYTPFVHFPKFDMWFRQYQFRKVFKKIVSEIGMPDVVHAHLIKDAAPAIILKTEFGIPFVITEHWTQMNSEIVPRQVMSYTFAYHLADQVICVSGALADSLREKCHVESLVINNMVSNQFFESCKKERKDSLVKFVGVGALRRNKRFDILVEAFALCHFPDNVRLDIIGEGEERLLIERKIKKYNVGHQVKLLGIKTPEEVNELLCQSDCFVLSSRLETFAIVVIEALAKGLPVIATRCGGPETFLRQEDGLLVEKENAQELAKAMKYMAEHCQEYNADEIRRHCHDNFAQDVIADKIIDVYRKVIS